MASLPCQVYSPDQLVGSPWRLRQTDIPAHTCVTQTSAYTLVCIQTGSWDGTLRLWDLNSGNTTRRFIGHNKDVLSVAFSVDNRQVLQSATLSVQ